MRSPGIDVSTTIYTPTYALTNFYTTMSRLTCARMHVYDARCNYDKVNVRVSGGPAGTAVDRQRQGM